MKVALVHDQLQEFGGAERVLVTLKQIFPEADIYTSFYNPQSLGVHAKKFKGWRIYTSWAEKVPLLKKLYSPFRFITPLIWESFDFSQYDLVISSSGSYMSKGIITKPKTVHICYLHHPPRYLYYYETAIEWQKYMLIKIYGHLINHDLRIWDYLSSQRPNYFIANSEETKRRIEKLYRREAEVIYPPVRIPDENNIGKPKVENYYITVSRLARAKHIDVLIQAANKMRFHLKIIGGGRDEERLKSIAGPTVELMGSIPDEKFVETFRSAKAFLFSAVDEEFGIAPVEAMGYRLPVVAYRSGGIPETVRDGINGYLFNELAADSIIDKIKLLESLPQDKYLEMKDNSRRLSLGFSEDVFKKKVLSFVQSKLESKP
jgi:glycosyltransferase involved in cell wall biosynthesis